ncbi:hypothetical protein [Novosphingobium olei]|uniref:Uncharacterized protein n=1 Tax=Novosphingobium olei TaxID=2728851 RepID=A0A7Y0BP26_9SPHN|nr:hypothetical protein [Novosphingobium olei]NML93760.1 hypothetical protein [Novosphingobium olei]
MTRLTTKEGICAYLGDIKPATYDSWQAKGIVPGPVPGTNRYDIRAHDAVLDRLGGLSVPAHASNLSPLEQWEQGHAA